MKINEKYNAAEKIRMTLDALDCCMLGGLDHVSIAGNTITYHDCGMNGKTRDLKINIKTKKWRTISHNN